MQEKPKYSTLLYVDDYNKDEVHHPETAKDFFCQIYLEVIDCFVAPLKERLQQSTYVIYAAKESLSLSITNSKTLDQYGIKLMQEKYFDDVDILSLDMNFSKIYQQYIFDIVDNLQILTDKKQLIPTITMLSSKLLINLSISAKPEM